VLRLFFVFGELGAAGVFPASALPRYLGGG